MKNCIRPHYEKLKPLKSGFMDNSNFENNRDPCRRIRGERAWACNVQVGSFSPINSMYIVSEPSFFYSTALLLVTYLTPERDWAHWMTYESPVLWIQDLGLGVITKGLGQTFPIPIEEKKEAGSSLHSKHCLWGLLVSKWVCGALESGQFSLHSLFRHWLGGFNWPPGHSVTKWSFLSDPRLVIGCACHSLTN